LKKILIIAYYFPPSGGPGVQRVLKFVKYFPAFGWEPVVLTVSNGEFPARDESLLKEIAPNVRVYRSQIFEPYSLYRRFTGKAAGSAVDVNAIPQKGARRSAKEKIAELIRSTIFIPDARVGWLPSAVRMGKKIIKEENISAIYSSSPPYTCALIGRALKRATGLPWIAGFRDPWTGFENTPRRWFIPRAIDHALERSVCNEADAIDIAWLGIEKDFRAKHPGVNPAKFHHLPNGFDGEDYPAIERAKNARFTLVYTGSLYGTRNPADLLRAVENLAAKNLIAKDAFVLKFAGRFGDEVKRMFENSAVKDCIETISYMPHSESIRELLRADALLLIVDEIAGSGEVVPGKVYEYLGAGKPILAIAPTTGAIAQLLRETGAGATAEHGDNAAIEEIFLRYYRAFRGETTLEPANDGEIKKYERKETTRALARLFNDLTQKNIR